MVGKYDYVGVTSAVPPDYARTARALTDAELEDEIALRLGGPEYQLALLAEHEARSNATKGI